ncbi:hypothetical protein C0992_001932, partial [Termitomyces sp. T32_za158]
MPAVGRAQVSTTPVVPLDASQPAEGGPRVVLPAYLADPFLARTPPAPSSRRAAPSPGGPTPKRPRRQPRSELDPIGETPLLPADVDQYLQEASRVAPGGGVGPDSAYMRSSAPRPQQDGPLSQLAEASSGSDPAYMRSSRPAVPPVELAAPLPS